MTAKQSKARLPAHHNFDEIGKEVIKIESIRSLMAL